MRSLQNVDREKDREANMKIYRSVPFSDVEITGGFWQKRQKLNREVTVKSVMERFMETGRFAAFACNWREGEKNKPHVYWDSDIAKWMEGVAYLIRKSPEPELEKVVEDTIDQIEINQDKNGYINSYFTRIEPSKRWTERWSHELYCAGHLMEAAVAWKEATGHDRFLKIMCRYADYIYRVFVEEDSASFTTPGHEEIELALVKLYHATGNEKYLVLSRYFVNKRGANDKDNENDTKDIFGRYACQNHMPVRKQFTAEGHSVRAGYLYSAMADIAREDGDEELKTACERLFDNIVYRRMYVTAGVGSTHHCEAFTSDYNLPNETAYTETCASIALAYFARRMMLLNPNRKYADVIERILYNGFLSGTSLDGKSFFYSNPLEINVSRRYCHPSSQKWDWLPAVQRVEVFDCSCCPPNITRFVASVGEYMLTESEEIIYLHQFMNAKAIVDSAEIKVETRYPEDGEIHVQIQGLEGRKLAVRIPEWCEKFSLTAPYEMLNGYAVMSPKDREEIILRLEMTPKLVEANPFVIDDTNKVAVMRGPVVYCMEGVDNGERIQDCLLDANAEFAEKPSELYGMPVLTVDGFEHPTPDGNWLYRRFQKELTPKELTLIPYYAFANRGESDMRVWIPVKR